MASLTSAYTALGLLGEVEIVERNEKIESEGDVILSHLGIGALKDKEHL